MKNINWKAVAISGVFAGLAFVVTGTVWPNFTHAPRHVKVTLGSKVLREYDTTNREVVTMTQEFGIGTNAQAGLVWVYKTNRLW